VGLGDLFDEKNKSLDYSELCVNDWSNITISESRMLDFYTDLRILVTECEPNNNQNILCEKNETKK